MSDWSKFTKRIPVNALKEAIYKAWATRTGIESWFLRTSEFTCNETLRCGDGFAQKGDKYRWLWHGWSDETVQLGEILEANGIDCFQFTFHDPMIVTVRILEEQATNIVELVQTNIELDEDSRRNYFVGCGEGWTFYLANLKSVLEGGIGFAE